MSKGVGLGGGHGGGGGRIMGTRQLRVDPSGMRAESLRLVATQMTRRERMRPIEVHVHPGEKPFLADGRHRLEVARARGRKWLDAIVRTYGPRGGLLGVRRGRIRIDA